MATNKKENKGYKDTTIEKFVRLCKEWIAYFLSILNNGTKLKMTFSFGNMKLSSKEEGIKVLNVSTLPIMTCLFCEKCKHFCYAIGTCLYLPNVLKAWAKNTAILFHDRNDYFAQIRTKISRTRCTRNFRWHVGGDIPDMKYLENMIAIAKDFPEWTFWTYTKAHKLVNLYVRNHGNDKSIAIPENLHIMYSEWDGMEMDNPFGFQVFAVRMPNGNKNGDPKDRPGYMACLGKCWKCIKEHVGCMNGYNVFIDLH